ncbi:hypothetical protein DSBG_3473 [Desulfosporosinus sp. BG]|nr:hypothetical protein DSBG_3473 [Desulfosporosinus sp. BG]
MKTQSPKFQVVTTINKRPHFTIKVEWGRLCFDDIEAKVGM